MSFLKKTVLVAGLTVAWLPVVNAAGIREAVEKTVLHNPEVRFRWHEFRSAAEEMGVGRAGYFPTLDVGYSVGNDNINEPLSQNGPRVKEHYTRKGWTANLTQNLFQGFQTLNTVRQLEYGKRSKYFDFLSVTDAQALEAVRAWLDVLRYRQLVELARDNYATHKGIYEQVREKVNAGVGRRVDLEQANGRLALAEANLITESSNLNDVSARYFRLVGEAPPVDMSPMPSLASKLPAGNDLISMATQHNPSYLSALDNIRASRSEVHVRRGAFSPTLDLRASKQLGDNLGTYEGRYDRNLIEFVVNINLSRGGADKARLEMAAQRLNSALDLRDKACVDMRQTAVIAYNDVRKLKEQLGALRQHRLSTEKARDAYRRQFDIGQRSLLDLLDSENELFDASRSLVNAEMDEQLAQARILAAIGTLLPALDLKPIEEFNYPDEASRAEVASCATDYTPPAPLDRDAIPAKSYTALTAVAPEDMSGPVGPLGIQPVVPPADKPVKGPADTGRKK
ncbi:TolC family outer membrane protein [Laribacter hongkongensis]|uniref:TolC family outer membrane protein n=1 Tax=Laribacter hongkongensis TaxID=168471 RepID=UPI001EFD5578|nr:TolC family outer membrane protein [Laribacter hongkongensis]MCG9095921.1 TolC family outer membrane protein [Laribacter hongkongensis]